MDIKLFYLEKGSGPPLILLHGNGESGDYFQHQMEYFSREYRVIAPDTRGHGRSPRGKAEFSISQFADDLNDFMAQMDIEQAVILGFSDGANIAMRFALKYQDRIKLLILNGGNLDASGVKPSAQLPIELGYRIARSFAKKSPNAKKNMEMLGLMVNDPNIDPSELSAIHVPTLVIAGTKDLIKEAHTRLIAESIPNARLKFLPGDHFIAGKRPGLFNEAVHGFLKDAEGYL